MKFRALVAIAILLGTAISNSAMSDSSGGRSPVTVHYFGGISGVTLPFTPRDEIRREQADLLVGYFRVSLRDDGRVMRLEKFLRGTLDFTHDYEYYDDGSLMTAIITTPGEKPRTYEFERGQNR